MKNSIIKDFPISITVVVLSLLAASYVSVKTDAVIANEINADRAKFNYQMFCQGCHTPDGTGGKDTPKIKGHIGNFLATKKGREYLVRVPGSANSTLDNQQLAEILNWIIIEMGGESVPENMQHYSAKEVAELRKNPLFEVTKYRQQLISEMD